MGQDQYIDESLRSFLVKLGGHTAEPAGGAALALAAASAAALMSLICHAGMRATDWEDAGGILASCQRDSEELARRIQHLVDADVLAYREVTGALRAAKDTEEERGRRARRLEDALRVAADVPLRVAEAGLDILDRALAVHERLTGPVMGDLAASVHLAEAAVRGSLRNAHINAASMTDAETAEVVETRIAELRARLDEVAQRAQSIVAQGDTAG